MSACTGTPISWLRLERYHAGELTAAEREEITAHLGACEACAACLADIARDERALPLLPIRPVEAAPKRPWLAARGRAIGIVSGLALAAALLVFLGRRPGPTDEADPSSARTKGDDVAFTLVNEGEGVLPEAGGFYRDGDRLKALVTCPPGTRRAFDLVVYERGDASFPLAPGVGLECGNQVPLPGAFRVSGAERMTVCLVWSDAAVDREAVRRTPPELLPRALCKTLAPAE